MKKNAKVLICIVAIMAMFWCNLTYAINNPNLELTMNDQIIKTEELDECVFHPPITFKLLSEDDGGFGGH